MADTSPATRRSSTSGPDLTPEWDRLAVLTFQGGGVYGLTLLGQLQAVHYDLKISPVALAGTSAGAIVATLYWAGLTPKEIEEQFARLADQKRLLDLLGPFEPTERPFTFGTLRGLFRDGQRKLRQTLRYFSKPAEQRDLCNTLRHVSSLIRLLLKHKKALVAHARNRGIFRGDQLEYELDTMIRSSAVMKRLADFGLPGPSNEDGTPHLLTFGDIRKLEDATSDAIFPPLFLTATNVTERCLRLFSSINPDHQQMPIARAARISGGFPFFFRPVGLQATPVEHWYVDGGVISNFPLWVFGRRFRQRLLRSRTWKNTAQRPWAHIGFRREAERTELKDLRSPIEFTKSLTALLTGNARDELERIISRIVRRPRIVAQPLTSAGGPPNVLDVDKIKRSTVNDMAKNGRAFANRTLSTLSFAHPTGHAAQNVEDELKLLIEKLLKVLGDTDNRRLGLRANIFLPRGNWLVMRYSFNMPPAGTDPTYFPLDSGLTGLCFTHQRPLVCNLQTLRNLAQTRPTEADGLFGMSADEHLAVAADRSWLLNVPIFDADEFAALDDWATDDDALAGIELDVVPRSPVHASKTRPYYRTVGALISGVSYGVLNVDCGLGYCPLSPANEIWQDPRMPVIVDLMMVSAFKIGRLFGEALEQRNTT